MSDQELTEDRSGGLLTWQLAHYPRGHTRRRNLVLHVVTAPLFCAGTVALVIAPFTSGWLALGGLLMAVALVAQGEVMASSRSAPSRSAGLATSWRGSSSSNG